MLCRVAEESWERSSEDVLCEVFADYQFGSCFVERGVPALHGGDTQTTMFWVRFSRNGTSVGGCPRARIGGASALPPPRGTAVMRALVSRGARPRTPESNEVRRFAE